MNEHERLPNPTQIAENLVQKLLLPQPEVVVVSGGPCGGKTSLLEVLKQVAAEQERPVIFLPELASQLGNEGVDWADLAANNRARYLELEQYVIEQEIAKVEQARLQLAGQDGLIICDRGPRDVLAYLTEAESEYIASRLDTNIANIGHDVADKVLYLPSVACGSPSLYSKIKDTNSVRYEDATQAATTCARTLAQWAGHPELHIVEADDFAVKLQRAASYCFANNQEYEQKWHVPNEYAEAWIAERAETGDMLNAMQFRQSYHESCKGDFRLRHGINKDGYEFFHFAVKQKTNNGNLEVRRQLTELEYHTLRKVPGKEFAKTRYVARHGNQLWHCDALTNSQGETFWIFEAEVASPEELLRLDMPLPDMQPSNFDTRAFADTC